MVVIFFNFPLAKANTMSVYITFLLPHPNPVLDYSGEHNIAMTSNPDGVLRYFHVICSYELIFYLTLALSC